MDEIDQSNLIIENLSPSEFWHELSDEERQRIKVSSGLTVEEFMQRYKQPPWCEYPEALGGMMGCWSLVLTNRIHSIEDCVNCDLCSLQK